MDNPNPLTFWNRIRMDSVVLFLRVSPKGSLFNLFLLACRFADFGIEGEFFVVIGEGE